GMVSLAGGLPAQESFPMGIMGELTSRVIEKYGSSAFQYDRTEGFTPLREELVSYLRNKGVSVSAEEILIASGSQGILDAMGKILITAGDRIAVEAPTYLGAISAFNPYEPEYMTIDTDNKGLIPGALEEILRSGSIKFVYSVPTFQNPTGRTIPLERRQKIAEIIIKHNCLLIEDDPYSDLRYRGEKVPPIKTLAPGNVVYVGTLSKVFAPGLRIGFCVAPEVIRKWLVLVKQGVDLHTSTFNQALAAEYISGGYLEEQLPEIIKIYRPRQEAMLLALENHFPDGFRWSQPEGGMFLWVEGPKCIDMEKIYWKTVERKTAFVPGKFFFTGNGEGSETMRLNYTMTSEDVIDKAVKVLSDVMKMEIQ
ncbi:MAG: PLP-dependent aminotransferase family protein, partial [Thermodesulfobacteriota bacterium]|nr:PLP-dependent aminotransferase family protein [Thermodesulfobacteriota bacterium]